MFPWLEHDSGTGDMTLATHLLLSLSLSGLFVAVSFGKEVTKISAQVQSATQKKSARECARALLTSF